LFSLSETSVIKELRRPPGPFFSLAASRLKGASAAQALVARFGSFLVPSVFVSISSDLLEQGKGWRHFDRGRGRHLRRLGGCEPDCVKKEGRPRIPGSRARGPRGKRQGDRSDVRQDCVRLKRARSGSSFWISGRAPALHACECLTTPAFEFVPLVRRARRMRPLSVGRAYEHRSSSDGSE